MKPWTAEDGDLRRRADGLLHRLLATPEGHADPYPLYHALRHLAPLHRSALDGVWYASSYTACRDVLGDAHVGKGPRLTVRRHGVSEERVRAFERRPPRLSMITANPPDHARLRRAAKGAFLPRGVEGLRARVARLVDERLERLADGGDADFMAALARPLPITVISELLDVPEGDRASLPPLVTALVTGDDPDPSPEAVTGAEAASDRLEAYFGELMSARRAHPGEDLLSGLVAQSDRGVLDPDELSATVALLFVAGSVTTTNLIGNGLLALIGHADQMRRLWHDSRLVEPAVEEMLRYDTPVQFIHRQVLEDTAVDGQRLRRGETVVALLAAANRDPARFPQPDRLQLERQDNTHLAFAWGIHFCLGARLARLEAQLAFSGLRQRFSRLDLIGEPRRRPGLALRGLESLPIHFTPR